MAKVVEKQGQLASIRKLPISALLRGLLEKAAEQAGVDTVTVVSGGQARLGTPGPRTGSIRHDDGNAADLELEKGGKKLDFTKASDQPTFVAFVEACAALGATGIGAGVNYMGKHRLHVGFGKRATWGDGQKSSTTLPWLKAAAQRGWNVPASVALPAAGSGGKLFIVNTRDQLNLRGGPGTTFEVKEKLEPGRVVTVTAYAGAGQEWAQVDLENDGRWDGYVFAAFLKPMG